MAQRSSGAQQNGQAQTDGGVGMRQDTLWLLPHLARQASGVLARMVVYAQQLQRLPRRVRRWLQRKLALSITELALLLALGPGLGQAATITVDGTTCTLVDAITAANTDTATGGCTAGSGADTLVLAANGTHTLTTVNNTTLGATGLPVVTSTITIQGNGSTVQRSGAVAFRLLAVDTTGNLTVQQLTLQGGLASGSGFGNGGGGVFNGGILTLSQSTLSGNAAFNGGGAFNGGTLTLSQSTLSGNTASYGGGMYNYGGGSLALRQSTLSGNAAFSGGGVSNSYGSTLTLRQSTLSGNAATYSGGGVSNEGTLTLSQSTLSGNAAAYSGGGVDSGYQSTLTLSQTLVAGNTGSTGPELRGRVGSTVTVNDHNLFGHNGASGLSNVSAGATDVVPSGALSTILTTTLAFNGGPTQTHALVSGSAAVDAVPAANCSTTDQRGYLRPGTGSTACDIGAFELNAALPSVVNSAVSFAAQPSTFSTSTTAPTGCPGGTVGTFSFQALLTVTGSADLEALKAEVTTLTQSNTLLLADGGSSGVGAVQTFAEVGQFSDGRLAPTETLTVPFTICLQNLNAFRFLVDVLGHELP